MDLLVTKIGKICPEPMMSHEHTRVDREHMRLSQEQQQLNADNSAKHQLSFCLCVSADILL